LKSKRECEEKMKVGNNIVNHPAHYTSGEIECIDALKASMPHAEFCGFLKGNAMKYLWRYDKKGNRGPGKITMVLKSAVGRN
jgi:hypothetical protein